MEVTVTTQQGQDGTEESTPAATISGGEQQSSPKPKAKRRAKDSTNDVENDPQFHDLNEMAEMEPETADTERLSRDLKALRAEVEHVWEDLSRVGAILKSVAQAQGLALNERARKVVHDEPTKTLAGAFGAGLLFGLVMAQCLPRAHDRIGNGRLH
jgi:hypothetical protein